MEENREESYSASTSSVIPSTPTAALKKREFSSFKLIVDPALVKASFKSYRYDGRIPEDPAYPTVIVRDPRNKMRPVRIEDMELPLPQFKIDSSYVGKPPAIQVTVTNLNDNIDRNFFKNILAKHWNEGYEDFQIFHHPLSNKHLGLAHVTFKRPSFARTFIEKHHNTSIMGQKINAFLDPYFTKCKELVAEQTIEKKSEENLNDLPKHASGDKEGVKIKVVTTSPGRKKSLDNGKKHLMRQGSATVVNCKDATTNGRFVPGDGLDGFMSLPGNTMSKIDSNCPGYPFMFPPPLPDTIDFTASPKPPWALNNDLNYQEDNDDFFSPKVDLDTRIRQVFSGPRSTLLGVKIPMLDSSDSEEEKPKRKRSKLGINNEIWSTESEEETVESAFAKKFKKNTFIPIDGENSWTQNEDMSPPPSPFLSLTTIDGGDNIPLSALQNLKLKLQAELEKVTDESNGLITARKEKGKKSREISVSPMSFEDPSEISLPPNPPLPTDLPPLPPGDAPLPNEPTLMPTQYYPHPGFWPPVPYPPAVWNHQTMECPPPYYHPPPQQYNPYQQPTDSAMYEPCSEEESDEENTPLEVSKLVMDRVFEELKTTLFKDFHRRLLENEAYKKFDTWCQKREEYHKASTKQQQEAKSSTVAEINTSKPTAENTESSLYDILGRGLGIRCSIPRLPSFRFRKVLPQPVDEDSRKSCDESESDTTSSEDEEPTPSKKALRRLSFTSDDSVSSLSSTSSSDSSSEEESDHEEEVEDIRLQESPSPPSHSTTMFDAISISQKSMYFTLAQGNEIKNVQEENTFKIDKFTFDKAEKPKLDEIIVKDPVKPPERLDTSHLIDHNYCRPSEEGFDRQLNKQVVEVQSSQRRKPAKRRYQKCYQKRDSEQRAKILFDIFYTSLAEEDVEGFRLAFENYAFDSNTSWFNSTHWVEYPATPRSPKRSKDSDARVHKTGSARTEGIYPLSKSQKSANRRQWGVVTATIDGYIGHFGALSTERANAKMQVAISREARSNQRRLLTALGNDVDSDLLKFNQLKFRKKSLRFGRSTIHDWGLFASECIAENEMVIEYVGQMIRPVIADLRERKYMDIGIGSSYLFRIDLETIIDATRGGNLSRFINHSCNPNCYAKIITIEGRKKIVIYSKQPIGMNEEITYDYKFPIEDEKIPCLCESIGCRGTLN